MFDATKMLDQTMDYSQFKNGHVKINENEGTITLKFASYYAMHHDSVMLFLLLNGKRAGLDDKTVLDLVGEYAKMPNLGFGYVAAHLPCCDADALCMAYGLTREQANALLNLKED
jgi:hypothetical protein